MQNRCSSDMNDTIMRTSVISHSVMDISTVR